MGLSSPGVGSGLDVNAMVSKLMAVESLPLTALTKKETSYNAKISALGTLKSTLANLQSAASAMNSATSLAALQGTVADSGVATATPGATALEGTYSLEVSKLAQAQIVHTASNPTLVDGSLTIQVGAGSSAVVSVNASDSISNVADRINADATLSSQLKASVVDNKLVLESKTSAAASTISVVGAATNAGENLADFNTANLTVARAAQDAQFKVNGIAIQRASNTVTDAISGVSLTLTGVTTSATSVSIAHNVSTAQTAISNFVAAYNMVNSAIGSLGNYDQKAALAGDSALRGVQAQLRSVLTSEPASLSGAALTRLTQLGVSVKVDGSLVFDATKLSTAFASDPSAVANAVAAYGTAMETATKAMVGSSGLVSSRVDGITSSLKDIAKRKDALSVSLAHIELRYRTQFTSLDGLMSSMTATSTFLTQQIASMSAQSK
ncbi:MAG: flagellar filament capping protein FliD [Rhodoferax sp.]